MRSRFLTSCSDIRLDNYLYFQGSKQLRHFGAF